MDLLQQYGFTPRVSSHFRSHFPGGGLSPARVVRVDRGRIRLAAEHGLLSVAGQQGATTGDWVAADLSDPDHPIIVAVMPRLTVLQRKRAHDPIAEPQVLAANADIVGIVVPIDRPISANRLERTLVAARDSGATPLVILTKADLRNRFDSVVAETVERAGSVDVVTTSAETGDGLDELLTRVEPGRTLVFLGPSGAGKSSLINALVGRTVQNTGAVRAVDGRGKHTTTARELIPLPSGAVLMDTPGLRGFALWEAEGGLDESFEDIENLFAGCRFGDCQHGPEPGCAVQAALASGALDQRRWQSYQKMERELASLRRRQGSQPTRSRGRASHQQLRDEAMAKDYRNRFRQP